MNRLRQIPRRSHQRIIKPGGLITAKRSLRGRYDVGGKKPIAVLDFERGYYEKGGKKVALDDAMTFSATSLRTMIDSTGRVVWAPHNFNTYLEPNASQLTVQGSGGGAGAEDVAQGVRMYSGGETWHRASPSLVRMTAGARYTFKTTVYPGTSGKVTMDWNPGGPVNWYARWDSFTEGPTPITGGQQVDFMENYLRPIGGGKWEVTVHVIVGQDDIANPGVGPFSAVAGEDIILSEFFAYRSDFPMQPDWVTGSDKVPSVGTALHRDRRGHYEGGRRTMLVEAEAATNEYRLNMKMADAAKGWTGTPGTREFGTPDPNNGNLGMKLTFPDNTSTHQFFASSFAQSAGDEATGSMWLRVPQGQTFRLGMVRNGGGTYEDTFKDFVGNGEWQRVEVSHEFANAQDGVRIDLQSRGLSPMTQAEVAWPQIEAGRYASSMIPTYDAVETRDAEQCLFSDLTPDLSKQTNVVDAQKGRTNFSFGRMYQLGTFGSNLKRETTYLVKSSDNLRLSVVGGADPLDEQIKSSYALDGIFPWKTAQRLVTDDFQLVSNEGVNITDNVADHPGALTDLVLAASTDSYNDESLCALCSFIVYPEGLTEQELIEVTRRAEVLPDGVTPLGVAPISSEVDVAVSGITAADYFFIDAANKPGSFSAEDLPVGLSIDSNSGAVSGTPTVEGITHSVKFVYVDVHGRTSKTEAFTWEITATPPLKYTGDLTIANRPSSGTTRRGYEEGQMGALVPQDLLTGQNITYLGVRDDYPTICVLTINGDPQTNGEQWRFGSDFASAVVIDINGTEYNFDWNGGNGRYQSTDIDFAALFTTLDGQTVPCTLESWTAEPIPPQPEADTILTGAYGKTQTDLDPPAGNGVIRATGASWISEIGAGLNQYPLRVRNYNGGRAWIYGANLLSDISQTEPWADLYEGSGVNSASLFMQNNGINKASGCDFDGCWDAMRFTGDYSVESMYVKNGRDDAIEADKQANTNGKIRNCYLESMVGVSFTETGTNKLIDIADTLIHGKQYPYNDPGDLRSFGPLKCDGTSGSRWKAHNVVLAVEDLNNNNNQARAWQVLTETTGDCRFLNLTDDPIGSYPAPPGGWGAGSGWTLVEGQAARDELAAYEAAWLAANRPYVPVEPGDP